MHLVEYINYEIKPTQEALLIKPIRKLYNQDRSKTKDKFYQALSILYFYIDPRSSYSYITDDDERLEAIIEQEGLPKNYKISKELQLAINTYKQLTTTISSQLLEDTYIAIDKVRKFLRNIDLYATDEKSGRPLYTISSVTAAIKAIPQLTKDIQEVEKQVNSDVLEVGRKRGGDVGKAMFEDGFTNLN
jgi:nucleotidyltransferase/DNA polymerase involved in DNA repair